MKLANIHEDERGKIMILTEDMHFPEVTVFITKAGYARGGCIHNLSDEYTCVIEGTVEYYLDDKKTLLNTGDNIFIRRETPHYYHSITDSIVIEWGATSEEKIEKHLSTRKIVNEINNKAENKQG